MLSQLLKIRFKQKNVQKELKQGDVQGQKTFSLLTGKVFNFSLCSG